MKIFLSLILFLSSIIGVNAQTHNHKLAIANASGNVVTKIYISRSGVREWGSDRLGNSVLPNNDFRYLDLLGHIRYDVKVVEEDGSSCTLMNIELDNDKVFWVEPTRCIVRLAPQGSTEDYN